MSRNQRHSRLKFKIAMQIALFWCSNLQEKSKNKKQKMKGEIYHGNKYERKESYEKTNEIHREICGCDLW